MQPTSVRSFLGSLPTWARLRGHRSQLFSSVEMVSMRRAAPLSTCMRFYRPSFATQSAEGKGGHVWSEEWQKLNFGALRPSDHSETDMKQVLFIETGFGCDQHGDRAGLGATKAAVRACRNAIEFNSIPCIADLVPGGRPEMKIKIRLGVPDECGKVDLDAVCAVFPYGKILPVEVVHGGLTFQSGRIVAELGDEEDLSVIVVACITVGC